MGRRKRNTIDDAIVYNRLTWQYYYNQLLNIAINNVDWHNLPSSVDVRFLELGLATNGAMVFMRDDFLPEDENLLGLYVNLNGPFDVYGYPSIRTAYGANNYRVEGLEKDNSVLVYNNYLHTNTANMLTWFAKRLSNIRITIEVNLNAQNTPYILETDEKTRLTIINAYEQLQGGCPYMIVDKKMGFDDNIKVNETTAPYLADKLEEEFTTVWNQALTYLGREHSNTGKHERLSPDEIGTNLDAVRAMRDTYLNARNRACEQMNKLWDMNVYCTFRGNTALTQNGLEYNGEDWDFEEYFGERMMDYNTNKGGTMPSE